MSIENPFAGADADFQERLRKAASENENYVPQIDVGTESARSTQDVESTEADVSVETRGADVDGADDPEASIPEADVEHTDTIAAENIDTRPTEPTDKEQTNAASMDAAEQAVAGSSAAPQVQAVEEQPTFGETSPGATVQVVAESPARVLSVGMAAHREKYGSRPAPATDDLATMKYIPRAIVKRLRDLLIAGGLPAAEVDDLAQGRIVAGFVAAMLGMGNEGLEDETALVANRFRLGDPMLSRMEAIASQLEEHTTMLREVGEYAKVSRMTGDVLDFAISYLIAEVTASTPQGMNSTNFDIQHPAIARVRNRLHTLVPRAIAVERQRRARSGI